MNRFRKHNKVSRTDKESMKVSVAFIGFFAIVLSCAIIGQIVYLKTYKKDYWLEVAARYKRTNVEVPAKRGEILADNGEVLAASIPEYRLYFDFMSSEKKPKRREKDQNRRDSILRVNMDSICEGMHKIFPDIQPRRFKAHLLKGRKKKRMNWSLYKRRVTYLEYLRVKQLPVFRLSAYRGGFHVDKYESRKNPYGKLAKRTIGDLYGAKDSARYGLELYCDSVLRGKPGVSHRERVFNKFLYVTDKMPQHGLDVQTTLNVTMQDICEQVLKRSLEAIQARDIGDVNFGVVILMDVATGDVKAMTSQCRVGDGSFHETQNRAVSTLQEPGSVFKPMSFLVAMNDGYLNINDEIDTKNGINEMYGRKMRDFNWWSGGFGVLKARQCIQKSSNVGVSGFIDRFYSDNPARFIDGIKATGVADDLHLPIPGYAVPRIKDPREKKRYWAKTDLPWMSIGYVTQIPPISTLAFYNGIANGGKMMRPRFIKAYLKDNEVVEEFPPIVQRERMASPQAVKDVATCLREVVTLGVGKKAGSKYVSVAGKTGTAQVWVKSGRTRRYFVSFAGFFPYEHPRYSMIVCIDKEGVAGGNSMCGPIFREVAERVMALNHRQNYSASCDTTKMFYPQVDAGNLAAAAAVLSDLGVPHSYAEVKVKDKVWGNAQTEANGVLLHPVVTLRNEMPNVLNNGLRDAIFRLEQLGLKVSVKGAGKVVEQSIAPGEPIKAGDEVELRLAVLNDKKRRGGN